MTIQIESQPYHGDGDIEPLAQFIRAINGLAPPHTFMHVGKLLWYCIVSTQAERQQCLRLWKRNGSIQGVAWFEPPNTILLLVHPHSAELTELADRMLHWATERLGSQPATTEPRLWTRAIETDQRFIGYLTAHGFERGALRAYGMVETLDHVIPAPVLPAGWRVRAVGGAADWAERIGVHGDVWHPSRLTLDAYARLRSYAAYHPDLDLVVVAPDGTFAAYALGWLDKQNGIGMFGPVGTRLAHRGQGLSTAVLREGMRRMQAFGARSVWITTTATNTTAASLYATLGFQALHDYHYSKPVARA